MVEDFDYQGPSDQKWISSGIKNTLASNLLRLSADLQIDVKTNQDLIEAMKMAAEKRKSGININLNEEVRALIGADLVCNGKITITSNQISAKINILRPKEKKNIASINISNSRDKLFELQDELLLKLIYSYKKTASIDNKLENINKLNSKNLKAIEYFTKGMEFTEHKPKEAIAFFSKTLEQDENYVDALIEIGHNFIFLKDYKTALGYLNKAEKILIDTNNQRTPEFARLLLNLGNINGNLYKDGSYYEKSLALYNSLGLGKTKAYLKMLINLSQAFVDGSYLNRASDLIEELNLTNTIIHADLYEAYASGYIVDKKYDLAIEYYQKALSVYEKNGYKNSYKYSWFEFNIGAAYFQEKKDYHNGLNYLQKSITTLKKIDMYHSESVAETLYWIGFCYRKSGNNLKAKESFLEAKRILESLDLRQSSTYSDVKNKLLDLE
ncbi:MAG TPA: tetratricopeptide repeat protein [Leptospiraceae bacterium]|nr:tetratricopeptide repeat protein [Leptospiraceae bacterium]HNC00546.1 tetratricopeptide repeat protein [Leptospiraceae bacterium]HNF16363.1 tetratricopeptide repeat protein [Leptospiraceae bacterium]HNF24620.1 tetratricopeptide repeat protein [Leptospiraceae bacterium]HNH07598.1 tetratricopeptide repeat protein [Leptospiraceae bacterium]